MKTNTDININNLEYAMKLNHIDSYPLLHKVMIKRMDLVNKEIIESNRKREICDCLGYKQFKKYIDHNASNPPISFYYALSKTLNVSIAYLLGQSSTIYPIDKNLFELFSVISLNKMLKDPNISHVFNSIFESEYLESITAELFKFFRFYSYTIHSRSDLLNYYMNTYSTDDFDFENPLGFGAWEETEEEEKIYSSIDSYLRTISFEDIELSISLEASKYLNTLSFSKLFTKQNRKLKVIFNLSRSEKFDDAQSKLKKKQSKENIAKLCNVSKNTLSRILNEKESFKFQSEGIINLCNYLNLSIDYFLGTMKSKEEYTYKSLGISELAFKNLNSNKYKTVTIEAFRPILESDYHLPAFLDFIKQVSAFNDASKTFPSDFRLDGSFTLNENESYELILWEPNNYDLLEEHNFQNNSIFINKCSTLLRKIKNDDSIIQSQIKSKYISKLKGLCSFEDFGESDVKATKAYIQYLLNLLNTPNDSEIYTIETYDYFGTSRNFFDDFAWIDFKYSSSKEDNYRQVSKDKLKRLIKERTECLDRYKTNDPEFEFEYELINKLIDEELD